MRGKQLALTSGIIPTCTYTPTHNPPCAYVHMKSKTKACVSAPTSFLSFSEQLLSTYKNQGAARSYTQEACALFSEGLASTAIGLLQDAHQAPAFSTASLTHISQPKTQLFSDNVGLCVVKTRGIFGSEMFGRNIAPHGISK